MSNEKTYTLEEVRDMIARVTLFSFDRGMLVAGAISAGRVNNADDHHLYKNIVKNMYENVGLPKEPS